MSRLFVIGGPLGLLVIIVLSLWVSWSHVPYFVVAQVDEVWTPGSTRAMRVQVRSDRGYPPTGQAVKLVVEQGGERLDLGTLPATDDDAVLQGTLQVPAELQPGAATLHLTVPLDPVTVIEESIELEVAQTMSARTPERLYSSSPAQYDDDSDAQPSDVKIDVLPDVRVLTGFPGRFWVRVTNPKGIPWRGRVQVALVSGELAGERGQEGEGAPIVLEAETDAIGLVELRGRLESETLRLEVRVFELPAQDDGAGPGKAKADEGPSPDPRAKPKPKATRRIKLVSYAGAVDLQTPSHGMPGSELELTALSLTGRRPIYVDVHDADGAWVDAFGPLHGATHETAWPIPPGLSGVLQLEGYDHVNAPGESTALRRVALPEPGVPLPRALRNLVARHEAALDDNPPWSGATKERERGWLRAVRDRVVQVDATHLRTVLLGTLPVAVYGPPTVLSTQLRDEEAMAEWKKAWAFWLRIALLGGGAIFLASMTVLMVRAHASGADQALQGMLAEGEDVDEYELRAAVHRERRAALLRGLWVIAIMAGGIILTALMLEKLVWL